MVDINLVNGKANHENYLRFMFTDVLKKSDAQEACQEWKDTFRQMNGENFHLIFNAISMKDYEPMARMIWQKTIGELKPQIASIWVVTNSKLIATGAKLMGLFTSFNIQVVNNEDKISDL